MSSPPHIVIVGTGLTALTLARMLLLTTPPLALRLTLLDKAKAPGGRLTTRYYDSGVFIESGARVFETGTNREFEKAVEGWEKKGWVGEVEMGKLKGVKGRWFEGHKGWTKGLVAGLVEEIREVAKGRVEFHYDAAVAPPTSPASLSSPTLTLLRPLSPPLAPISLVIHTAPPPQVSLLLPTPLATPSTYHKTLVLLLPTLSLSSLPIYHRDPHPSITSISTGRSSHLSPSTPAGLCVQSTPEKLGLDYATPDAEVRTAFFAALRESGLIPEESIKAAEGLVGRESQVKRWKFAQVAVPGGDGRDVVQVMEGGRVILAGDGTSGLGKGGGVEGAWIAGVRAAEVVKEWIAAQAARENL
ncbi:hypothetical protein RQP46_003572 [Phenoliferia psychrophenolica]